MRGDTGRDGDRGGSSSPPRTPPGCGGRSGAGGGGGGKAVQGRGEGRRGGSRYSVGFSLVTQWLSLVTRNHVTDDAGHRFIDSLACAPTPDWINFGVWSPKYTDLARKESSPSAIHSRRTRGWQQDGRMDFSHENEDPICFWGLKGFSKQVPGGLG